MKNKKLLFLISVLAILIVPAMVSADVNVNHYYYDAQGNPVTNVDVVTYLCLDSVCDDVGDEPLYQVTGNKNVITLTYPTNLLNSGYAVYSFKTGYVPIESYVTWAGTGNAPDQILTFYKIENAHALVDNFVVTNDAKVNIPLVIEVPASLDTDTHSAFHNNQESRIRHVPQDYLDFYSADTEVTLTILDAAGTQVYTETQEVEIYMDSLENVEFSWTPTAEGLHTAVVTTEVVDNQVENSLIGGPASATFTVQPEEPKNECYAIVNNLQFSNENPIENEEITVSFTHINNYADNIGDLTAVDKEITINIYEAENGQIITDNLLETFDITLPANQNAVDTQTYSFQWTATDAGEYGFEVVGISDDILCAVGENTLDTRSSIILITENPNTGSYIDLPVVRDMGVLEGNVLTFAVPANYDGSLPLTYTINGIADASVDSNGVFTWTADYNTISHEPNIVERLLALFGVPLSDKIDVTVRVNEVGGILNAERTFTLQVYDVNRNPEIQAPPVVDINAGDSFDVNDYITISDADNDELTITYSYPLNSEGTIDNTHLLNGAFVITITAMDNFGGEDTESFTLNVNNPYAPRALITYKQDISDPSIYRFKGFDSYSPIDKTIVKYEWDFGDGETKEGASVTHNYAADSGSYYVTLTVTDENGRQGRVSILIGYNGGSVEELGGNKHQFSISNIVVNEKADFIELFVQLTNRGNNDEDVTVTASIENTNINSVLNTELEVSETTWQIFHLDKPKINGQTVFKVVAQSDDYDTTTYRVVDN